VALVPVSALLAGAACALLASASPAVAALALSARWGV
jgi:hypothetical protein